MQATPLLGHSVIALPITSDMTDNSVMVDTMICVSPRPSYTL